MSNYNLSIKITEEAAHAHAQTHTHSVRSGDSFCGVSNCWKWPFEEMTPHIRSTRGCNKRSNWTAVYPSLTHIWVTAPDLSRASCRRASGHDGSEIARINFCVYMYACGVVFWHVCGSEEMRGCKLRPQQRWQKDKSWQRRAVWSKHWEYIKSQLQFQFLRIQRLGKYLWLV